MLASSIQYLSFQSMGQIMKAVLQMTRALRAFQARGRHSSVVQVRLLRQLVPTLHSGSPPVQVNVAYDICCYIFILSVILFSAISNILHFIVKACQRFTLACFVPDGPKRHKCAVLNRGLISKQTTTTVAPELQIYILFPKQKSSF